MKRFTSILAMALLCGSVAADAYQGVGSHIRRDTDAPRNLRNNDPASAERAANAFARCVADQRGTLARDLLAVPYRDDEQVRRAGRLIGGSEECMDDIGFHLSADGATLIGGMAEHYVRGVYGDDDLSLLEALSDERVAELGLMPRNGFEFLGLCVARRDPNGIRMFVSTEPGSDEEQEALQTIVPNLGPCVPEGETIRMDRRTVRSITAVGLYRVQEAVARGASGELAEAAE